MLYNGTTDKKLAEYLNSVVTQDLGLPVNGNISHSVLEKLTAQEIEKPIKK